PALRAWAAASATPSRSPSGSTSPVRGSPSPAASAAGALDPGVEGGAGATLVDGAGRGRPGAGGAGAGGGAARAARRVQQDQVAGWAAVPGQDLLGDGDVAVDVAADQVL